MKEHVRFWTEETSAPSDENWRYALLDRLQCATASLSISKLYKIEHVAHQCGLSIDQRHTYWLGRRGYLPSKKCKEEENCWMKDFLSETPGVLACTYCQIILCSCLEMKLRQASETGALIG